MSTLDRETLNEIAAQCLTRPSNAHFYDDRLFDTHGAMLSWSEQSNDLMEESNYLTALGLIKGAAGDDADAHIIDGSERHFACGYMRVLYVQVYESYEDYECDCEPTWEHEDECAHDEDDSYCQLFCRIDCDGEECLPEQEFTAAFKEAAELVSYLQGDGAILDDSDYFEREYDRWLKDVSDALDDAQREYVDDTAEEEAAIRELVEYGDRIGDTNEGSEGANWSLTKEIYADYRDTYFEEKAYEVYRWNVLGYNPDQLELDIAV
ncbi:hypothetical protein PBI_PAEDORE_77 [Streptomyces phage Paedore]|uniref:Uncharacterized protein n=1 Tax=Streptomyces phage Paedore TaxID=2108134 RepID=A0A2P1JTT8_9CAUD|nr:hypothetical protein KGG91_gp77 [Streptomyces phage Paedore]AVO22560.1 hypothetical protein PBI_PAEDORE_77 [Streptomyces phage Paedore]